jgi:hypothetical protein
MKMNLINNQEINLRKLAIRCKVLSIEEEDGEISFTNNQEEIAEHMNQRMKPKNQPGDLRVRKENDGLPKELVPRKIPALNKKEKMIRTVCKFRDLEGARQKKDKIETEKEAMKIKEEKEMILVEEEKEKGFKIGNNPKVLRSTYCRKNENANISKQELRSNTTVRFISHNVNMGKWWHDPQIKKEDYRAASARLAKYILGNKERTITRIIKYKEEASMKKK